MRRGFVVVEALAACFLAGVATVLALQFFLAVDHQRRTANERLAAGAEAANIIDRLSMIAWSDLPNGTFAAPATAGASNSGKPAAQTIDKIAATTLSPEANKLLPQAAVVVEVTTSNAPPEAKRICVRVQWEADQGDVPSEVRLVTWKYRGT